MGAAASSHAPNGIAKPERTECGMILPLDSILPVEWADETPPRVSMFTLGTYLMPRLVL
jgi:hypothetical protein